MQHDTGPIGCPECSANGLVSAEGFWKTCPRCHGSGQIPKPGTIEKDKDFLQSSIAAQTA